MRRVVVTGMGMVTPLGCGVETNWARLIEGRSGIGAIESFDVSDMKSKIAGQVPLGAGGNGAFNAEDWLYRRVSLCGSPGSRAQPTPAGSAA